MRRSFDTIVLGCGGIGSGALYWLARRSGADVLGLEQFALGHHHGGSQDHSRIIRLIYHHQDYTRLTPHTYAAWATVEHESDVRIVTKTGGLELAAVGSPLHPELDVYAQAMAAADIPFERFDEEEVMRRYPQFQLSIPVDALYQAETGIADAAKGNATHIALARAYGATIHADCPVTEIRPYQGGVAVYTAQGMFDARRLVVTAGAWTAQLLADLGLDLALTVTQEQVTYYATPHLRDFAIGRFPVFIWRGDNYYYGFPVYGEVATKAAMDASGPVVTVDSRTYEPDAAREAALESWLAAHIPGFLGPRLYTKSCLYTMPRDRNFIVDAHPEHPQILLCVGAGHAYKFASLLGRILSELAIDGRSSFPIAPFSLQRPAIVDPDFASSFVLA